jgi:hypothetical protein
MWSSISRRDCSDLLIDHVRAEKINLPTLVSKDDRVDGKPLGRLQLRLDIAADHARIQVSAQGHPNGT